jgi:hypothetical protein
MVAEQNKNENEEVRVPLGQVVATANAARTLPKNEIIAGLQRHAVGDWGDVDGQDRESNDQAIQHGDRLLSVYHTTDGTKFWIITEWDRSVTTVLMPSDY